MKNFFKSLALTIIFFMIHMAVQILITSIYVVICFSFDLSKGVIKVFGNGTYTYRGAETALEDIVNIYNSQAALPGIIITAIFLVVSYYFIFKLLKIDFLKFINLNKPNKKQSLYGLIVGVTSFFPVIFLISSTFIKDLSPETDAAFEQIMMNNPFILQLIGMGIAAPIIEEITFRGLIYTSLRKSIKVVPSIIIQAILFGVMHMNLQQFIYASLLGIIFGFVLEWTDSIMATILAHIGFNTISLLTGKFFSLLEKSAGNQYLNLIYFSLLVISTISFLVVIYSLYKNRRNLRKNVLSNI